MKRIVLCSDGTGNSGGKGRGTNVWKIYTAVERRGHEHRPADGPEQLAVHDDGVGTSDFKVFKMLGGIAGWGLGRNIRDLYTALASCYELGDRLYLFGFSRGAFTIRSLAGMISRCGIVDRNKIGDDSVEDKTALAYQCYRKAPARSEAFRKEYAVHHPELAPDGCVPIHFIGVWDTVDAVGVPFDWLRTVIYSVARFIRRPHDHDVNPNMKYGYHAISIDDERRTFDPVMWDEHKATADQTIRQVWFAGVHSNVGGGYPRQGLSAVTLDWIMQMAENAEPGEKDGGLRFTEAEREKARGEADVYAKLYDSRAGLAAYFRYRPRHIEETCRRYCKGLPKVHISALQRIQRSIESYAPGVLPMDFDIATTEAFQKPHAELLTKKLAETRDQRVEARKQFGKLVKTRVAFYHTFVALTVLTIGMGAYFQMADRFPALPDFAGFFPAFNATVTAPSSDTLLPMRAFSAVYRLVPGLVNSLIPASWETFVNELFSRVDVVLLLTVLLSGLLVWRQKVKRRMKRIVQRTWKAVFTDGSTR